ncbi:MAG: 2-iminoacetate synthase ThiH [Candidatus Hydrogenedentes bacterium]|nr:2-iminoacetate synthase ThiH [Candidatus Hydrogenedentota bacterium]
MSFLPEISSWPAERVRALYDGVTGQDALAAIAREERTPRDLAALLSPAARPYLEAMAREAQRLTRWHFGRTINLYAPIYISNLCAADCVYCGYAARSHSREKRVTLRPEQIDRECAALAAMGYDSVLLLTGEAPKIVPPARIAEACEIARRHFSSVSVEVYAMEEAEYALLAGKGLDGTTLYQETYDRDLYREVHLLGQKMDYDYRLDALERAGRAGVRRLSAGALLGLGEWRFEAFWTALHARHLQKACWKSAVSVSFPRLRHMPERFQVKHPVSDADLVQIILALRLFLPEAGFNLSTREPAALRDRLIPLGITAMSAGSSTRPGGYATKGGEVLEQFEVEDTRSPAEVVAAIRSAGYDPVWKDFDHAFNP